MENSSAAGCKALTATPTTSYSSPPATTFDYSWPGCGLFASFWPCSSHATVNTSPPRSTPMAAQSGHETAKAVLHDRRAKAEVTQGDANPRFLVTSLAAEAWDARGLYEDLYCARGEMENRLKECQLDL